ncbi:CDP-alcohol phosphatidyltransferase family protein [Solicola sp. PLA-1-18]|uniref:CDP-alcohol phosphatidyltransferase family protein n=1 Tax=Solicola sp. PLA-1-18 TaxID=3380532 RepID=UPI003B815FDF
MSDAPRPARPTFAEFRAIAQPPEIRARKSAEHWTADLYLRDISPYLSRPLVRLGFSANGVTGLMILCGWAAAASLLLPGLGGVVLAVFFGQLQMLVDCCDGEVARWRGTSSPAGVFLDKIGHYTTEALIPIALGVRAAGGVGDAAEHPGWIAVGALLAVVIMFNKALNDMVHVSRAFAGLPRVPDSAEATAPRPGLVARLRRAARFVPFHRLYHSVELTLLALAAAVVDLLVGGTDATRVLVTALLPLALLAVVGHVAAIMASSRLKA